MRVLLPDQQGPHRMQAKYIGKSSCNSILMPLFLLRVWWGASGPGTTDLPKSSHTLGSRKHQCIIGELVGRWLQNLGRETPGSSSGESSQSEGWTGILRTADFMSSLNINHSCPSSWRMEIAWSTLMYCRE